MLNVEIRHAPRGAGALIRLVRAVPAEFAAHAAADGFTAAPGSACEIINGGRVLLVGVGQGPADHERAGSLAASRLLGVAQVALQAEGLAADIAAFAAGFCLRAAQPGLLRSRPDDDDIKLAALDLVGGGPDLPAAWAHAQAAVAGTLFARALVTEPANTLTPCGFVERLAAVTAHGVTLDVLDEAALAGLGAGALLAVGQGSANPPCLAVLRWAGEGAPLAFVGKGITFDTGGLCIKPAEPMWEMRADMAGAAACAGAMLTIALRRSSRAAIAVLALAENAVGARAYRPGDVVHTLAGTTVEVIDTDAEGRMVLADGLEYARRLRPSAIVDIATLTGSTVVALGHEMAGLMGNDEALIARVRAAAAASGEPVWRMPIAPSHRDALDSQIADLRHCVPGSGHPDGLQAAAFLREFVGDVPWAHLDIAGVEEKHDATECHPKGATGFGARLLSELHG